MALKPHRRTLPKPFHLRELTRDDLSRLDQPRALPTIKKLRDSHHRIAELLSLGLSYREISERTGYSYVRISVLAISPSMEELIAKKRAERDKRWKAEADEYVSLKTKNMIAAERHISDHIDQLDEEGELLPIKQALAISSDGADRLGYGKKKDLNVNLDFAANLEAMLRRSGKVINGTAIRGISTTSPSPAPEREAPQPASVPPAPIRRRI